MKRIYLLLLSVIFLPLVSWQAQSPEHDVTQWHAPGLFHHHGGDPATADPILQAAMDAHWSQEIGSAWVSSVHENEFPAGDHAGFKNIIETNIPCPNIKPRAGDLCINGFVMQVHAMGTMAHSRKDIHSFKGAFLVCESAEINTESCGYVIVGAQNDYINTHSPYIKYHCEAPDDPDYPEEYQFLPPYVAIPPRITFANSPDAQNRVFWSSAGPGAAVAPYVMTNRGYLPNRMVRIVWGEMDAWDHSVGFSPLCSDPASDTRLCPDNVNDSMCKWNGTEFSVFTIELANLPASRPFSGYTDRHGNVQPPGACVAEGVDCIPLIISVNVPQGLPALRRPVAPDPELLPRLNYDDGTLLRKPPFTLP